MLCFTNLGTMTDAEIKQTQDCAYDAHYGEINKFKKTQRSRVMWCNTLSLSMKMFRGSD